MQSDANKKQPKVLVATADIAYGATLSRFLEEEGIGVERCPDAAGVLRLTQRRCLDVIVLDLTLDTESDVDLISFIRQQAPSVRLIILFEIQQMEHALDGVRQGAFFFLPRDCPPSDVALVVSKALQSQADESTIDRYEKNVFEELIGQTDTMQRVLELIRKVSPTDSTVLLLGESGTGKEVVANTIHRLSSRRHRPFIAINCAALPEALLESELFGHLKGAFTGADRDKRGLFEEAEGGTVFLDEIGDMALITQAKLLRVLQNGEIRPVGASTTRRVDVRIIAATHKDLVEAVQKNGFREDLYFRLNVIQIRIPPLRERMDALPSLINHFIKQHNLRFGKNVRGLDEHAGRLIMHYPFPGNVRELESIIAHAVIMADSDEIRARDLPEEVQFGLTPRLALPYSASEGIPNLAQVEERHIRNVLERLDGNQTLAAQHLGISRSTLWRKMRDYKIPPK